VPALKIENKIRYTFLFLFSVIFLILFNSCEFSYPEIVVVNMTSEHILIRNMSFNGCLWNTTLAYGKASSPKRCLPGSDRVHFEKFDAKQYCREQVEDGTIEGICLCDENDKNDDIGEGLINEEPMWFKYQTNYVVQAGYGDFIRVEIKLDEIQQDFSVPGPYGH